MKSLLVALSIVFVGVAASGCTKDLPLISPQMERGPIVFESDIAKSIFEDDLDDRYDDGEADVPQMRGRLSKNAFFNQEIEKADTDNDGIVTDVEVQRYVK